ncbi:MAG: pentapeptide repeat-containing protein [Proteobacteria bacterium]|nr:pentapeptide repeat-containing protein [Pseudomonadota bacterium]
MDTNSESIQVKLPFIGKYAIYVYENGLKRPLTYHNDRKMKISVLSLRSKSVTFYEYDDNQTWNIYGDLKTGFVLQNGISKYVSYIPLPHEYYIDKWKLYSVVNSHWDNNTMFFTKAAGDGYSIWEKQGNRLFYFLWDGNNSDECFLRQESFHGDNPSGQGVQFHFDKITDSLSEIIRKKSTKGKSLTGVYLANENLHNIDFICSELSFADFSDTDLSGSKFGGYDPSHTIKAINTIFDRTKIHHSNIAYSYFENCSFVKASVIDSCVFKSEFMNCDFNCTDFGNSELNRLNINACSMINCNFSNTMLCGISFLGCDLANADLQGAKWGLNWEFDISDTKFIGANLCGLDFQKYFQIVKLNDKTLFRNAKLDGCNFSGLDLRKINFAEARMEKVNLEKTQLDEANMNAVDLTNASIKGGVSMIGINLTNAILESTNFEGAQMGAKTIQVKLTIKDIDDLKSKKIPLNDALKFSMAAKLEELEPQRRWKIIDGKKTIFVEFYQNEYHLSEIFYSSNTSQLSNAYMHGCILNHSNLANVSMNKVYWVDGKAVNAIMSNVNFGNSILSGTDLTGAKLQGATFDSTILIGTKFIGAYLGAFSGKNVSFSGAFLGGASFEDINGLDASFSDSAYAFEYKYKSNGGEDEQIGIVPLFTIPSREDIKTKDIKEIHGEAEKFIQQLKQGEISKELKDEFKSQFIKLSDTAKFSDIIFPDNSSEWIINNIDETELELSASFAFGYSDYLIRLVEIRLTDKSILNVLRIYGANNYVHYEKDNKLISYLFLAKFGSTNLMKEQLHQRAILPSGNTIESLTGSNYDWEGAMTAHKPRII